MFPFNTYSLRFAFLDVLATSSFSVFVLHLILNYFYKMYCILNRMIVPTLQDPKLEEQEQKAITQSCNDAEGPLINETAIVSVPTDVPVSSSEGVPSADDVSLAIVPKVPDIGLPENGIPGLESSTHSYGLSDTLVVSSVATDLEEASQDQVNSLGRSSQEIIPSISTDRSEELSPKAACMDTTSINSSTATSLRLPSQLVLPKMSAPVISLDGEQMDSIQKMSFMRIVEAYKHIAVAGGSQVRFSLLAYLGVAVLSSSLSTMIMS